MEQRAQLAAEVKFLREELGKQEKAYQNLELKEKEAKIFMERDHKKAMRRMEEANRAADRDFWDVLKSKNATIQSVEKKAGIMAKNAIAVANSGAGSSSGGPRRDLFLAMERAGEAGQAANREEVSEFTISLAEARQELEQARAARPFAKGDWRKPQTPSQIERTGLPPDMAAQGSLKPPPKSSGGVPRGLGGFYDWVHRDDFQT
jgi:hypothetical protein